MDRQNENQNEKKRRIIYKKKKKSMYTGRKTEFKRNNSDARNAYIAISYYS